MRRCLPSLAAVLLLSASAAADEVDYLRQIKPILAARCYACHGALKQESGLRLDTGQLVRQGGESGPAIEPGSPEKSLFIGRVSAEDEFERMPPEGQPLAADEIALLTAWIDQGASSPTDEAPQKSPDEHWAFRPIVRPEVPVAQDAGWVQRPIDAFIAEGHQRHGLTRRPPAEKHVLLRRVFLDLIGLPPTRDELHAFLADTSGNAYESAVERLLESPQYGERWGRHWMDVWRYSDWYGRRGQDDVRNSYPHIWRWRDWIVRSLNDDKGYDRMVVEMLAADEVAPEDDDTIVATGFIVRNWFSLNYDEWMKDLVEHTGKAFLGLRFNCAHCHDHKYDPILQEDYFKLRAFFEPLELRRDRVPGGGDLAKFEKYVAGSNSSTKPIKAGLPRVIDKNLAAETYMYAGGDARNRIEGKPPISPGVPRFLSFKELDIQPMDLPPVAYYPGLKPFVRQEELSSRQSQVRSAETALAKAKENLAAAETRLAEFKKPASPQEAELAKAETALDAAEQKLAEGSATADSDLTAEKPDRIAANDKDPEAALVASVEDARLAVRTGEAELEQARRQLMATEARIAADQARYEGGPGEPDALAKAASLAEREAAVAAAEAQLALAERQLAATQRNRPAEAQTDEQGSDKKAAEAITKGEQAVANANKAIEKAKADLEKEAAGYQPFSPTYPKQSTGRRTALARWITDPRNPLTARVAVNHIWLRHFGRPLVESVADFGLAGKDPSHPALLDWLAAELIESGWSMKHLHRLIVTSNAYRMDSTAGGIDDPNLALDQDNRFLWRFNTQRMHAEVVRDSVLHLSGRLDLTMGGQELDENQGLTSRRRSLYFAHHAEGKMKFLELFDAANPCDCYRRTETVVPHQALAMTNSQLAADQSRILARKLWEVVSPAAAAGEAEGAFITAAFEQILTRSPSSEEVGIAEMFLEKQRQLYEKTAESQLKKTGGSVAPSSEPDARSRESLVRALLSHNDFVTIR